MDNFVWKIGAAICGGLGLGGASFALGSKINALNEKEKREHERYIMEHPHEYEACRDVTRFENLQREKDSYENLCESYKREIKGLKKSVNYYKNQRNVEVGKLQSERDEALSRLQNYVERDLNDIRKKCGIDMNKEAVNNGN